MAKRITRKAAKAMKRSAPPQKRVTASVDPNPPGTADSSSDEEDYLLHQLEELQRPKLLSLGEASKLMGVSKSTVWRAIKSGKLSASARTDEGEFRVEPSELHRVFGETRRSVAKMVDASAAKIEGLEQMLAFAREQLAKAELDRDRWREQAEAAQRLLIDARPKRFRWFGRG